MREAALKIGQQYATVHRMRIVALAAKHRLPVVYVTIMSHQPTSSRLLARAANCMRVLSSVRRYLRA